MIRNAAMVIAAVLVGTPAAAQDDVGVKLSPNDGCWRYSGDAISFHGKFRKGAYLGVTMATIDEATGLPVPDAQEGRVPVIDEDVPTVQQTAGRAWFGPLPESRQYTIMFSPRAEWGTNALVTVCGRTSAPQ